MEKRKVLIVDDEPGVRESVRMVLKDQYDSLLVGVFVNGHCKVNPPNDTVLLAGSDLLVVRERPLAPH